MTNLRDTLDRLTDYLPDVGEVGWEAAALLNSAKEQVDALERKVADLEKTVDDLTAQLPKPKTVMVAVESSNVKSIGYELDGNLMVEFKNHTTYRYKDVPSALYERLVTASSVGSLLNEEVRGRYEYERVQ